jgi:hypothetical protein
MAFAEEVEKDFIKIKKHSGVTNAKSVLGLKIR